MPATLCRCQNHVSNYNSPTIMARKRQMAIICLKYHFSSKAPFVCPVKLNIFLFDFCVQERIRKTCRCRRNILRRLGRVPAAAAGAARGVQLPRWWLAASGLLATHLGTPAGSREFAGGEISVLNVLVGLSWPPAWHLHLTEQPARGLLFPFQCQGSRSFSLPPPQRGLKIKP